MLTVALPPGTEHTSKLPIEDLHKHERPNGCLRGLDCHRLFAITQLYVFWPGLNHARDDVRKRRKPLLVPLLLGVEDAVSKGSVLSAFVPHIGYEQPPLRCDPLRISLERFPMARMKFAGSTSRVYRFSATRNQMPRCLMLMPRAGPRLIHGLHCCS